MGLWDDLKRMARPYADDEDDFEEEYEEETADEEEEEEEEEEPRPRRASQFHRERETEKKSAPRSNPGPAAGSATGSAAASSFSSASLGGNTRSGSVHVGGLQMILVKPEKYQDVSKVADHLRNRNAVVLNLEETDRDTSRRLVDFLSGCAYALDGNIRKVATNTYVIAPANMEIVGNLTDEAPAEEEEQPSVDEAFYL